MSYEKQTWNKYDDLKTEEENIENGAVVTDNRMNHIEEGIGDNDINLASHLADKNNPHKVTAAQVGLGNVQNFGLATEDEAKQGISSAKYMTPSLTQAVLSANINSIAYANSANGTDGFTTVYPNLNLLNFKSGLILGKYLDWATGMLITNNVQRATFDYVPVMPNAKYTLSANWTNGGAFSLFGFNSKTDSSATTIFSQVSNGWIPLSNSGQFVNKNMTVTIPNEINFIRMSWFNSETLTLQNLLDAKPKLELGTTATTWMPSASEVTTADWPKFVGFSNTVKTNKSASDYTWFPVKDSELTNKVESHINNKANPHAVTASQVGAYSKQEIDTKFATIQSLTDLENKSISNKGNLAIGDDLNVIRATGFYRIGGFFGGTEILNVPAELSGVKFYAFVTVTEALQELTVYAPTKDTTWTYSRSISGSPSTWSAWSKTVMADESGKVTINNLVASSITRPNDTKGWVDLVAGTSKYKVEGSTVTLSWNIVNGSSVRDIPLGTLPANLAPSVALYAPALAARAVLSEDRHLEIGSNMIVKILSASAGQTYNGQFKYDI